MVNPITPEEIKELKKDEVFCFESNLIGIHNDNTALLARKWGAKIGYGNGPMGRTYAIPTKDCNFQNLSLKNIQYYVHRFINYAKIHPEYIFLVTKIGCRLEEYTPLQIAPLFLSAVGVKNIALPESFLIILVKE